MHAAAHAEVDHLVAAFLVQIAEECELGQKAGTLEMIDPGHVDHMRAGIARQPLEVVAAFVAGQQHGRARSRKMPGNLADARVARIELEVRAAALAALAAPAYENPRAQFEMDALEFAGHVLVERAFHIGRQRAAAPGTRHRLGRGGPTTGSPAGR